MFSQAAKNDDYDGFLTLNEIMKLDMRAETVTLPGSEAPVDKDMTGEPAMNMGRAFQHSGCRNVLMSLRPMIEDTSLTCSKVFLKSIQEGKEPAEALKKARDEIRDSGFEHPYTGPRSFW